MAPSRVRMDANPVAEYFNTGVYHSRDPNSPDRADCRNTAKKRGVKIPLPPIIGRGFPRRPLSCPEVEFLDPDDGVD